MALERILAFLHRFQCLCVISTLEIGTTQFAVCAKSEQDIPTLLTQRKRFLRIDYGFPCPYATPPKQCLQQSVLCSEIQRLFSMLTRIFGNSLKHGHIGTDALKGILCADGVASPIQLPARFKGSSAIPKHLFVVSCVGSLSKGNERESSKFCEGGTSGDFV